MQFLHLDSTLYLWHIVDFFIHIRLKGKNQLHFLGGGGGRDFVYLGKTLADVHECFIFGLREDNIEVDWSHDAHDHKHQKGIWLQSLLYKQKTNSHELDECNSFYSARVFRKKNPEKKDSFIFRIARKLDPNIKHVHFVLFLLFLLQHSNYFIITPLSFSQRLILPFISRAKLLPTPERCHLWHLLYHLCVCVCARASCRGRCNIPTI